MPIHCPRCGSKRLRHHKSLDWLEKFKSFLGLGVFECGECGVQISEAKLWVPSVYARCPKCLRQDLSDWKEKYAYPSRWVRLFLYLGARQQRCGACRHNFVSFFPRRYQYNPSWRQAQAERENLRDTVKSELPSTPE